MQHAGRDQFVPRDEIGRQPNGNRRRSLYADAGGIDGSRWIGRMAAKQRRVESPDVGWCVLWGRIVAGAGGSGGANQRPAQRRKLLVERRVRAAGILRRAGK
jgi:hypothetical protein